MLGSLSNLLLFDLKFVKIDFTQNILFIVHSRIFSDCVSKLDLRIQFGFESCHFFIILQAGNKVPLYV